MTAKKVYVTGAAGQTGIHTLKWLSEGAVGNLDVYAGVYKADQAHQESIIKPFNTKASVIEGHDLSSLTGAFRDVQDLFIIPPATADKVEIASNYIKAAREAGVKFVLLLSVVGAEIQEFTWGAQFHQIEDALKRSGIENWCILRTNFYAQNLLLYKDQIKEGTLPLPTGDGSFAPVDVDDVALAAKCILADCQSHVGKSYQVTGREALNGTQIAQICSKVTGRQVAFKDINESEATEILQKCNVPNVEINALIDFYRLAKQNHFKDTVNNDFNTITRREPTSLEEFLSAHKTELTP